MRLLLAGAMALVGIGTSAHADTIASAPAHGGSTQTVAVCYIFNFSSDILGVSSVQIIREPDATVLPVVTNNCSRYIGPGVICRTVSNVTASDVVACKATLSPKGIARGALEIRNSSNTTLNSQDLR